MAKEVPIMPIEYIDTTQRKKTEYTLSAPRSWTEKEIEWVLKLRNEGFTAKEISESVSRTPTSVSIKLKRLGKKSGEYNAPHIQEKYKANKQFVEKVKPKTVLDVYCGQNSYYKSNYPNIISTTNDKDTSIEADYHMDATKFCALMYSEGNKYDIVDLDPFGSAYQQFPLAIMMAKKGLVITLGEMGHKRWRRIDYVGRVYGIESLEEFTEDRIIEEIISLARKYKVLLEVDYIGVYRNISRVYFNVSEFSSGVEVDG